MALLLYPYLNCYDIWWLLLNFYAPINLFLSLAAEFSPSELFALGLESSFTFFYVETDDSSKKF